MSHIHEVFNIAGKLVVVTGASSDLGRYLALSFGRAGAKLALVSRRDLSEFIADLSNEGINVRGYISDVLDRTRLEETAERIEHEQGPVDVLINMAGGNRPEATTSVERTFFDIDIAGVQQVIALNLFGGAMIPCQAFGRSMRDNPRGGSIINISSMAAARPLTRVMGYAAAKAAVENFTKWLATYLAVDGASTVRVNAIAPGFFLTEQNRYLLYNDGGEPSERCKTIVDHTPMGRLGRQEDLAGAALFLGSDASAFVTGTVIPVDGGFGAFSGV